MTITTKQQRHQIKFFTSEYNQMEKYKLAVWQQQFIDRIKKTFPSKRKLTILDIASGSGYVAIELAKLCHTVYATDITPQSITILNKQKKLQKLSHLNTLLCPAEKIPLKSSSIDVIIANAILEHIPSEIATIRHWLSLLKPNGFLVITVPLKFKYIWPFLWYFHFQHDKRIGHLRRYDLPDLQRKIALPLHSVYYSGNIIKIIGLIINKFIKSSKFEKQYEYLDSLLSQIPYGANNMMAIFRK